VRRFIVTVAIVTVSLLKPLLRTDGAAVGTIITGTNPRPALDGIVSGQTRQRPIPVPHRPRTIVAALQKYDGDRTIGNIRTPTRGGGGLIVVVVGSELLIHELDKGYCRIIVRVSLLLSMTNGSKTVSKAVMTKTTTAVSSSPATVV
jgi:hypothetical protein